MGETTSSTRDAGTPRRWLRRIADRLGDDPAPLAWFTRQEWYPWLIVGLVSIGAFIGQLDATIVQLALPTLGKTFAASLENVSWVSLAYLVAFASCLPIFGRLCEMFGRKWLYLAGYVVFIAASALCGLAPDLPWLIAFRVLQGIGGSILGANSISILAKAVGQDRRGRALGFFAAAQAIGMSAGPVVGGLVLGAWGWHWVFWVSVPFGLAAAVLGWLVLPRTEVRDQDRIFDWRGALLLGPALIFLVLALNQVSAWGITSPVTIAFAASSLVLIWLLVRQERASASPLVDLRLFRSAAFSRGVIAVVLGYAMLYGMFFLMSFALEHGYGDSPAAAGLRLAVIPVALGLVAPLSGGLSDRFGGSLLSAAGAVAAADPDMSRPVGTAALALFGAGLGVFIAPSNHATLKAAPAALSGEAGSMLNLMRVLGTSLGVASASSTLSWRLESVTGAHGTWIPFAGHSLLNAFESSLAMLAVMAVVAGAVSLVRTADRATRREWLEAQSGSHSAGRKHRGYPSGPGNIRRPRTCYGSWRRKRVHSQTPSKGMSMFDHIVKTGLAAALLACLPGSGTAFAQDSETARLALGASDYQDTCAACHGVNGHGDGPVAEFLKLTPIDLTKLARNNGGAFPAERVAAVIDGRQLVKIHGPRDMPVWGQWFDVEADMPGVRAFERDIIVRERIASLVDYLKTIQVK